MHNSAKLYITCLIAMLVYTLYAADDLTASLEQKQWPQPVLTPLRVAAEQPFLQNVRHVVRANLNSLRACDVAMAVTATALFNAAPASQQPAAEVPPAPIQPACANEATNSVLNANKIKEVPHIQ